MVGGNPVRWAERLSGAANRFKSLQTAEKGSSCAQMKLLSPKLNKIFILFNLVRGLKTSFPAGKLKTKCLLVYFECLSWDHGWDGIRMM